MAHGDHKKSMTNLFTFFFYLRFPAPLPRRSCSSSAKISEEPCSRGMMTHDIDSHGWLDGMVGFCLVGCRVEEQTIEGNWRHEQIKFRKQLDLHQHFVDLRCFLFGGLVGLEFGNAEKLFTTSNFKESSNCTSLTTTLSSPLSMTWLVSIHGAGQVGGGVKSPWGGADDAQLVTINWEGWQPNVCIMNYKGIVVHLWICWMHIDIRHVIAKKPKSHAVDHKQL